MKSVRTYFEWRDGWVGVYLAPGPVLYVCPAPFWVWRVEDPLRVAARAVTGVAGLLSRGKD